MRVRPSLIFALLTATVLLPLGLVGTASAAPAPHPAASPAAHVVTADQQGTVRVFGFLRNTAEDNEPVEGVTIAVTTTDGEEVGSATTDDKGAYSIEVPGPGAYVVELDEDTLPDGVELRDDIQNPLEISLSPNEERPLAFAIGPDTRDVETWVDRIPQTLWNGFYFGIVLALGALGLSVIFGTTGLTNFAHGELLTFGALVAFFFNSTLGLPLILAGALAVVASGLFGLAQDRGLWRPLRKRGTGLVAMMIVSIGMALTLRNIFQIRTGGRTVTYTDYITQDAIDLGLFTATPRDMIAVGVSIVTIVLVSVALLTTRIGKATRAVADNPSLASATGIDVDRVISVVWVVGGALAGLGGFLLATSIQVNFQAGAQLLLLMFAAVTLGGLGTVWGAMLGSVIVGIFIEVSTLIIPSELKYAGALFILILVLLVRPQGLLGRRERVG